MAKGKYFTIKEKRIIKKLISDDPFIEITQIADELNRSYPAVRQLILRMGFKKVWTR